ncbi:restriction endonuclease [Nocardia sp. CDC159]|uniref:Restriction endonuclease n=1 Tax=Nocardia pulmonis TaxID=2951408 RepID=A0A9X2E7B5_9NOCA|nr:MULTISPECIES: restriction endonuclease [Nocardia]MCM6774513.1 restriction endonuclease [Nocardia pulmonis]MCM6787421.1 restriction endonuclease [Nocardia sp. CDC159]
MLKIGVAGFIVLAPLWRFAHDNPNLIAGIAIAAVMVVALALGLRIRHRRRRAEREQDHLRAVLPFHHMNDKQFEHALASLCRASGCREVQVSGGAGDRGADVKALTPDGRRPILQAKRYNINRRVGDREMQQLAGGLLTWHEFDIAVLVTTSSFTRSARETATRNGIRLVDNKALAVWNSGTGLTPWDDMCTRVLTKPSVFARFSHRLRGTPLPHH